MLADEFDLADLLSSMHLPTVNWLIPWQLIIDRPVCILTKDVFIKLFRSIVQKSR
jgi:hypothetical protein